MTPNVPCNLKIQSANHFFFLFVSYLYKFKELKFIAKVQVHCQELRSEDKFCFLKKVFSVGVSKNLEEIMQIKYCSKSAELFWGEI